MRALVALALLGLIVLPSVPAAADAPHVLVRLLNDGDATTATVRASLEGEAPYFEREFQLAAGERLDVRVDGKPGAHVVSVELPERPIHERSPRVIADQLIGPSGPFKLEAAAYNEDCPGPYAIEFGFDVGSSWSVETVGCTVLTDDFAKLLDEARIAKIGFPRAAIEVPAPGSADRGVYGRPEAEIPFEWRAEVVSLDEHGREARGPEVTYVDPFMSGMGFGGGLFGEMAWASAEDTIEVLRYRDGEARPMSWSVTRPADADQEAAVHLAREIRYDDASHVASCLLRNVFQGKTIRSGDTFAAEEVCPIWPGADWQVRAPIDWGGMRALPLYQVEETEERTQVARLLLVDDVPYVAAYERFTLPAGKGVRWTEHTLEKLDRGGERIALVAPVRDAPQPRLGSLDALRGPALTDTRFAFDLGEAVDAALADPLLGPQLAGAILAGAAYAEQQDAGSPAKLAMWLLTFVEDDTVRYIGCERAAAAVDLPLGGPIRCQRPTDWSRYAFAAPVFEPPPMTREDLPNVAPSFDLALARWDAARSDGPADAVTFAVYRAWTTPHGDGPVLAVGLAPPRAMTPAGAQAQGTGDHIALRLDGTTLAVVELTQTASTLDPGGLALFRAGSIEARDGPASFGGSATFFIGSGALLAALALLGLLLYSRLVRARVLDDATRARIRDAVAREPGLHAAGVLDRIGKRSGVGEYHLAVLVREGFLTAVATPGFTRYFVSGRFGPNEMRALAALREGQNEKLLAIIRATPGIQLSQLAEAAGLSLPYASKGVARLVDAGLVDKVQVGRAVALHAVEA